MNDEEIDVSDIDPAELLAALYNNGRVMGMGFLQARNGEMTREQADRLLRGDDVESDYAGAERTAQSRKNGRPAYFDYLHGKPMKLEINGKTLRSWGYDRDYGQGAAMRVVEALRAKATA